MHPLLLCSQSSVAPVREVAENFLIAVKIQTNTRDGMTFTF